MITDHTKALLAYSLLKGVGPAKLRELAARQNIVELEFGSDQPVGIPAIDRAIADKAAWRAAQNAALRQVDAADRASATILSALDSAYPFRLVSAKDDPFILFVLGTLPQPETHTVAVIGTREPTRHGAVITKRLTEFLVAERSCVVSGLAIGCDSIAHETCIAQGGHTIAVLAHGLHTVAPAINRGLADAIVESGGALVTEYAFGVDPIPQMFVRRDSTQAGVSDGVVMIQSDLKGGSLHAARATLKYGRWLAIPVATEQDKAANAPKVQANLLFMNGSEEQRRSLLGSNADLSKVILLRGREDYPRLLERISKAADHRVQLF